jgi:hypothetical protein
METASARVTEIVQVRLEWSKELLPGTGVMVGIFPQGGFSEMGSTVTGPRY